jgi:quinoprotein glucose dehydrogenase
MPVLVRTRASRAAFVSACLIGCADRAASPPATGTDLLLPKLAVERGTAQPVDWPHYGGDPGQQRRSPLTDLDRTTVGDLRPAWIWWAGDTAFAVAGESEAVRPGFFEASPLVIDDTLYVVTPFHRVVALDATTGHELWRFDPGTVVRPIEGERGGWVQRGLATWSDGRHRRLFLASAGRLFAIDAASGRAIASFGPGGSVSLTTPLSRPVNAAHFYNTSPPVVFEQVVIVGSSVVDRVMYDRDPPGALLAFDARSGRPAWSWSPFPAVGDPALGSWDGEALARAGHMNVWSPFTLDVERGLLFVGVSGPSNDYYGGARPGDDLYSQSLVCLDARTGARRWHFQLVHHDVWDYDPAAPPVLVETRAGGSDVPAVAVAGKTGFVYVFERVDGRPIWPIEEVEVPASDVPGERLARTQPMPTRPAPFARQRLGEADLAEFTPEIRELARRKFRRFRSGGLFTPPSLEGTIILPGWIGGAGWGATAYDPARRVLFVKASELPVLLRLIEPGQGDPSRVGRYVLDTLPGGPDGRTLIPVSTPKRFPWSSTEDRYLPLIRPPYGTLTAIAMDSGEHLWRVTLGDSPAIREHPALAGLDLPPLGVAGPPGPSLTASDVLFVTGGGDQLYALDATSGATLWQHALGDPGYANPVLYRTAKGRPFVVIAVGGPPGMPARLMAFTLPPKSHR